MVEVAEENLASQRYVVSKVKTLQIPQKGLRIPGVFRAALRSTGVHKI